MRRLSLLRHAKSSWDDPELNDHERQLTKRGTRAVGRIGRYIVENKLTPDLIVCSDAIRTRATLALLLATFDQPGPEAIITDNLYLADPDAILRVTKREAEAAGAIDHVMVIGHNPGLHALALSLPGKAAKRSDLRRLAMKYPTAALAHITFDVESWSDVKPATGTLERFIVPRELSD